jgi:hypothetical protein
MKIARTLSLAVLLVASIEAQSTFGTINGVITDATGALVPNAKVTVRNEETGIAREISSDNGGYYEASHLQPGRYTVTVEQAGFRQFVRQGLALEAGRTLRSDISLEVGEVTTQVVVEAHSPTIETETSQLSAIRTHREIQALPMNLRGSWDSFLYDFLALIPTAQWGQGSAFSIGGTRGMQNNFTVDGSTTNSPLFGNSIGPANPSMEGVAEMKVDLNNNSAEYVLPGTVHAISKAGTNEWHGSLLYYHDNGALNARDFFATRTPFRILHDFGGSIGGPIRRNRTFFFFDYEGFRDKTQAVLSPNVPTAKFRQGDFSSVSTPVRDAFSGQPLPGNRIPASLLNPTSLKIQERFYPLPNFGDPDLVVGNWRDSLPQSLDKNMFDVRGDHRFSDRHSVFGRFSWMQASPKYVEGGLPTVGIRDQLRRTRSLNISDTITFRPNLINEFRFGIVRNYNPRQGPIHGPTIVRELGLEGLPPNLPDINSLPTISITGFQTISQIAYLTPAEMIFEYRDTLSWIRGRHSLRLGFDLRHNWIANEPSSPSGAFGSFSFQNTFTGYSYADFLYGLPRTSSRLNPAPRYTASNLDAGFFLQDDFRLTKDLTLNLGLRYDLNPPYTEHNDRMFGFDPSTGAIVVPSTAATQAINPLFPATIPIVTADRAGLPASLRHADRMNLAPRAGFAWRLRGTTVLRGGYGIYTDYATGSLFAAQVGGPFQSSESFTNTITGGVPRFQFPRAFPPGFGTLGAQNVAFNDPYLRLPYIQQANFTVEQEIFRNWGLRLSYITTASRKLTYSRNINQPPASTQPFSASRRPYPALQNIIMRDDGGNQTYHGFSFVVEHKYRNGLYLQSGWTWAKNLTDVQSDSEAGATIENQFDRRRDYSNVDYTRRHRWISNLVYELPVGPGKRFGTGLRGIAGQVAGGWQISAILLFQTGGWLTPSFSGVDTSNTNTIGGRPDRLANGNLPAGQRTIDRWFDASAFAVPRNGSFGNAAPTIIEGPGTSNVDLGLYKFVRVRERFTFRLGASATNAFNHPNFGDPALNISSPSTVGIIRSLQSRDVAGPRTVQLSLRLDF